MTYLSRPSFVGICRSLGLLQVSGFQSDGIGGSAAEKAKAQARSEEDLRASMPGISPVSSSLPIRSTLFIFARPAHTTSEHLLFNACQEQLKPVRCNNDDKTHHRCPP